MFVFYRRNDLVVTSSVVVFTKIEHSSIQKQFVKTEEPEFGLSNVVYKHGGPLIK